MIKLKVSVTSVTHTKRKKNTENFAGYSAAGGNPSPSKDMLVKLLHTLMKITS